MVQILLKVLKMHVYTQYRKPTNVTKHTEQKESDALTSSENEGATSDSNTGSGSKGKSCAV